MHWRDYLFIHGGFGSILQGTIKKPWPFNRTLAIIETHLVFQLMLVVKISTEKCPEDDVLNSVLRNVLLILETWSHPEVTDDEDYKSLGLIIVVPRTTDDFLNVLRTDWLSGEKLPASPLLYFTQSQVPRSKRRPRRTSTSLMSKKKATRPRRRAFSTKCAPSISEAAATLVLVNGHIDTLYKTYGS